MTLVCSGGRLVAAIACAAFAVPAAAQNTPAATHAAHAAAPASAPAKARMVVPYRSAFTGYRAYDAGEPMAGWRDANELTGKIGGWRAYAREASGGASAPAQGDHGSHRTTPAAGGSKP